MRELSPLLCTERSGMALASPPPPTFLCVGTCNTGEDLGPSTLLYGLIMWILLFLAYGFEFCQVPVICPLPLWGHDSQKLLLQQKYSLPTAYCSICSHQLLQIFFFSSYNTTVAELPGHKLCIC